jgi:hypothetical protein
MPITQSQAISFVNETKSAFLTMLREIVQSQATALQNNQQTASYGGGQAVVDAVDQVVWDATFPNFTKAQFVSILGNMGDAADLLGAHGDLKTNLYMLKD